MRSKKVRTVFFYPTPIFNISIGLVLCVSYSTIYGGLATLVGSAVTIFLKGYVDEYNPFLILF